VGSGSEPKYCDKPPELNCLDYADNDFDGRVDCEDSTSCTGSAQCAPGPGPAGSPCQIHGECFAGQGDPLCISAFQLNWPGGYCSEWCDIAANDCPSDATCVSYLNLSTSGQGQCLRTCTSGADCRPGYFCNPVFPFNGTSVCVP
jgi:hypothetical protein